MIEPDGWWRDYTGRFGKRPFYQEARIERAAVDLVNEYLEPPPTWPLSDDQLDFLADMVATFDRNRDVSEVGADVDAFTIFASSARTRPMIVLSSALNNDPRMKMRRRMTIAHEIGHVVLHQPLYARDPMQLDLLPEHRTIPNYCSDPMSSASVDWCEWQASYFGGALLAPKDAVMALDVVTLHPTGTVDRTPDALHLIATVARHFEISKLAARVRLSQLGLVRSAGDSTLPLSSAG